VAVEVAVEAVVEAVAEGLRHQQNLHYASLAKRL